MISLFWRKKTPEVDLGELGNKQAQLREFLRKKLKVQVESKGKRLVVESSDISVREVERFVNKFVYHQNLNAKYWVASERKVVRIHRMKGTEKPKESKESVPPNKMKHGW